MRNDAKPEQDDCKSIQIHASNNATSKYTLLKLWNLVSWCRLPCLVNMGQCMPRRLISIRNFENYTPLKLISEMRYALVSYTYPTTPPREHGIFHGLLDKKRAFRGLSECGACVEQLFWSTSHIVLIGFLSGQHFISNILEAFELSFVPLGSSTSSMYFTYATYYSTAKA